ncbi:hypothetical protein lerEdw1_014519 [Lerista edwardsae]|nr:hypothetical protein lerEdw1_014519 [Lerista edwardsae]
MEMVQRAGEVVAVGYSEPQRGDGEWSGRGASKVLELEWAQVSDATMAVVGGDDEATPIEAREFPGDRKLSEAQAFQASGGHDGRKAQHVEGEGVQQMEVVLQEVGARITPMEKPAAEQRMEGEVIFISDEELYSEESEEEEEGQKEDMLHSDEGGRTEKAIQEEVASRQQFYVEMEDLLRLIQNEPWEEKDLVKLWAFIVVHMDLPEVSVKKDLAKFSQHDTFLMFSKAKNILVAALKHELQITLQEAAKMKSLTMLAAYKIVSFRQFKKARTQYPAWISEDGLIKILQDISRYWEEHCRSLAPDKQLSDGYLPLCQFKSGTHDTPTTGKRFVEILARIIEALRQRRRLKRQEETDKEQEQLVRQNLQRRLLEMEAHGQTRSFGSEKGPAVKEMKGTMTWQGMSSRKTSPQMENRNVASVSGTPSASQQEKELSGQNVIVPTLSDVRTNVAWEGNCLLWTLDRWTVIRVRKNPGPALQFRWYEGSSNPLEGDRLLLEMEAHGQTRSFGSEKGPAVKEMKGTMTWQGMSLRKTSPQMGERQNRGKRPSPSKGDPSKGPRGVLSSDPSSKDL